MKSEDHLFDVYKHRPILRTTTRERKRALALSRLANEYVIDFNIRGAVVRSGLDWNVFRHAEDDTLFAQMVQDRIDMMDPDSVISKQELFMAVKKEAFTADKAAARVAALALLARLRGMELPTKIDMKATAPIINLTMSGSKNEADTL